MHNSNPKYSYKVIIHKRDKLDRDIFWKKMLDQQA